MVEVGGACVPVEIMQVNAGGSGGMGGGHKTGGDKPRSKEGRSPTVDKTGSGGEMRGKLHAARNRESHRLTPPAESVLARSSGPSPRVHRRSHRVRRHLNTPQSLRKQTRFQQKEINHGTYRHPPTSKSTLSKSTSSLPGVVDLLHRFVTW